VGKAAAVPIMLVVFEEEGRGGTLPLIELRILTSALAAGSGTSDRGSGATGVLLAVDGDGDGGGIFVATPELLPTTLEIPAKADEEDVPDPDPEAAAAAAHPPAPAGSTLPFPLPLPSTERTNGTNLLLGGLIFSWFSIARFVPEPIAGDELEEAAEVEEAVEEEMLESHANAALFFSAIVPFISAPAVICIIGGTATSGPFPLLIDDVVAVLPAPKVDEEAIVLVVEPGGRTPPLDVSCHTVNPQSCGSAFSSRFLCCSSVLVGCADTVVDDVDNDDDGAGTVTVLSKQVVEAGREVTDGSMRAFLTVCSVDDIGAGKVDVVGGGVGDGDSRPVDVRARGFVFSALPLPLACAFTWLFGLVRLSSPSGGEGCNVAFRVADDVRSGVCVCKAGVATAVDAEVNNRRAGLFPGVIKDDPACVVVVVPRIDGCCRTGRGVVPFSVDRNGDDGIGGGGGGISLLSISLSRPDILSLLVPDLDVPSTDS
jgi:hypothetical protein